MADKIDIKQELLNEIEKAKQKVIKLQGLIIDLTSLGLDWDNVFEIQASHIRKLAGIKNSKI